MTPEGIGTFQVLQGILHWIYQRWQRERVGKVVLALSTGGLPHREVARELGWDTTRITFAKKDLGKHPEGKTSLHPDDKGHLRLPLLALDEVTTLEHLRVHSGALVDDAAPPLGAFQTALEAYLANLDVPDVARTLVKRLRDDKVDEEHILELVRRLAKDRRMSADDRREVAAMLERALEIALQTATYHYDAVKDAFKRRMERSNEQPRPPAR